MASTTAPPLSSLVQSQLGTPSPIRQIMKMAERKNILAMGLDPDDVISFGGGWVNHEAPEAFRQAYQDIVNDPETFHRSGAYTATLGDLACREQIARFDAHLFAVPRLGPEHVAIGLGSSQITRDLFTTLLDPGDAVMLLDPTYANYEGQIGFVAPGARIVRLPVVDAATWTYRPQADPEGVARDFIRLFDQHRPKLVLFGAPDNPTSQVVPQALAELMLERTAAAGSWLAIDCAYKCQYFQATPEYYRWSPTDHPHLIAIHSNSKWARGLGRRLGWIEASTAVVDAIERVQQCSILCPDTLSQMAMARFLARAIDDGSLRRYVDDTNALYREAATVTLAAIDAHIGMRRLDPFGGLYTVMDVGRDADQFVPDALKATGVLLVPGRGFGPSIANGVRVSYGPLVRDHARITEGLRRLGGWMRG
ncbi:MAG: pyridoxal phosphate-dependent aminotransferase [Vicinamibacterales bacterium]